MAILLVHPCLCQSFIYTLPEQLWKALHQAYQPAREKELTLRVLLQREETRLLLSLCWRGLVWAVSRRKPGRRRKMRGSWSKLCFQACRDSTAFEFYARPNASVLFVLFLFYVCGYKSTTCMQCPQRLEEGFRSLGTGGIESCEWPWEARETSSRPWKEQPARFYFF